MANWCNNYVSFTGGNLEGLRETLLKGEKYIEEMRMGWLPEFLREKAVDKYLFDIRVDEGIETSITMRCESKWSPPKLELSLIAKHFNCDMDLYFEEINNQLFGYTRYSNNLITSVDLNDSDFDKVEYNSETDTYSYKGEVIESSYEIYEELLKEKILDGGYEYNTRLTEES